MSNALNNHLVSAYPVCAFRFNDEKFYIFSLPDFETVGHINGYILVIERIPYFIQGGTERLCDALSVRYSDYLCHEELADVVESKASSLIEWSDECDDYVLTDDAHRELICVFDEAMQDARSYLTDCGEWERE